jgi:hypothetical protein
MFDWFFKLFRKEKIESVPVNINLTIHDLKKGCILDYDMDSWEVVDSYTYKYKGYSSKEYKIRSSDKTRFLNVTDSSNLYLSLSAEANINNVDGRLRDSILKGQPIAKLDWENEEYVLKEATQGQFTEDKYEDWCSFNGWEYVNSANSKFVYVSKWEDNSIECYAGDYLKEHQVTNVLATT